MPRTDTPRAAWGSLSRDQVVTAARSMLAADGLDALTIRALARELGVAPMSIYRHVASKADLLDQVVDLMLGERWAPDVPERHWREWTLRAAQNLLSLLVEEPAARAVYLDHPVVSAAAVQRMRAMLDVLRRGLGSDEAAEEAYAVVQSYTIGFATLQAARARWQPGRRVGDDVELARQVAEFSSPAHFVQGLLYLLDGIARR